MELVKTIAKIEKMSKIKNVDVQTAWDMFFLENFLCRLSLSAYVSKFVFKGGFYLQSILGVESRSTMNIDLKMIDNSLENDRLRRMMQEICNHKTNKISYTIKSINDFSKETKCGGKTVKIEGKFYNIRTTFGVDIGIGDIVTPEPIEYFYQSSFTDEKYVVLAYPIETIIAEKFETLISKGANNSRLKDILDLFLLEKKGFDESILTTAIINTFCKRETKYDKDYIERILNDVFEFERTEILFNVYRKKHSFAQNIKLAECKKAVFGIFSRIHFAEKINLQKCKIEIHLVRHGQDEEDKLGGWSSNHLIDKGIKEIEDLILKLDNNYDLFISSDLERTKETALILNQNLKMDIKFGDEFREMNNGVLADLTKIDAFEKYPRLYFSSLRMDESYPKGESPIQFYNRIKLAFARLVEKNKNKKILLVTHGGVITIILSLVYGYEYSNKLKIAPSTGSLTVLK